MAFQLFRSLGQHRTIGRARVVTDEVLRESRKPEHQMKPNSRDKIQATILLQPDCRGESGAAETPAVERASMALGFANSRASSR